MKVLHLTITSFLFLSLAMSCWPLVGAEPPKLLYLGMNQQLQSLKPKEMAATYVKQDTWHETMRASLEATFGSCTIDWKYLSITGVRSVCRRVRPLIYRDPEISCFAPLPVQPRPMPPVLSSSMAHDQTSEEAQAKGVFYLQDVYQSTQDIPRGTIQPLLYHDIAGTCGRDEDCKCLSCWVRKVKKERQRPIAAAR